MSALLFNGIQSLLPFRLDTSRLQSNNRVVVWYKGDTTGSSNLGHGLLVGGRFLFQPGFVLRFLRTQRFLQLQRPRRVRAMKRQTVASSRTCMHNLLHLGLQPFNLSCSFLETQGHRAVHNKKRV
jgi:hypothetical protein